MNKIKITSMLLALALLVTPLNSFAFEADSYANKIIELGNLINKCEEMGICVDYEKINYNTIRKCVGFMEEDTNNYSSEINQYNEQALSGLYNEAIENIMGYLSGTKTPKKTYIYQTGDFNVDGKSIKADSGRPIYSIGVGHGTYANDDIENLTKYGYNNIQIDVSLSSFIVESADASKDYEVNKNAVTMVQNLLKKAEDSNVAVSLLLSTHYFPQFLLDKYPSLATNKGNFGFNLQHEVARSAVSDFLHTLMPAVKDYKSLTNICLANEPSVPGNNASFYNPYFRDYLKNLYGNDIAKLNATYGSSYNSFDEVEIPTSVDAGAIAYDWMQCHDGLFAEYLSFMKGIISKYTNVPTHVKIFRELEREETSEAKGYLFKGIGLEQIKTVSGMAGCDEESYYRHGGGTSAQETFRWYDMLSSLYEMPVYNSEDHVIGNGDERYAEYQNTHVKGYLWQAAMHGLGASTMWIWERSYTTNQFKNSILTRPDVIAGTGKVNYELNRLAYQVNAFAEEQPDVAILYSEATRIHNSATLAANKAHMSVLDMYYLGSLYAGEKVGFITDLEYKNLSKYKVLIIPQVTNTTAGCLAAIKTFIENGGKVIIYENGISSLSKDEHNLALDSNTVSYITSNSYKTSTFGSNESNCMGNKSIMNLLISKFDEYIPTRNVKLVDLWGNNVFGVDWNVVSYNGATLINLCNYNRSDLTNIKVKINGQDVTGAVNLLTDDTLGTRFGLKEMTPVLLQVGTPSVNENEIPIEPDEVGDSGIPQGVTDVTYTEKILSWSKAYGDTSYSGANVYLIDNTGKEVLIGTANGTRWCCIDNMPQPAIIKIKPFNIDGIEGEESYFSTGMSEDKLEVTTTLSNKCCTVTAKNTKTYPIHRTIRVLVKNQNGKLVAAGGRTVIVLPGESVTFNLKASFVNESCTAIVVQE